MSEEVKHHIAAVYTGKENSSNLKYDENYLGNKDLYLNARYECILDI